MRSFPRQQQYRRLRRAGACAAGSTIAGALTVIAIVLGAIPAAGVLLPAAVVLAVRAHHWVRLAGRSRVGAHSEDEAQRALAPLQAEGWRLRHSLPWQGRGDIDSVAIAPTGIAIAIETKTKTYDERHLARVRDQAVWLSRRRQRWCRHGALAVLCLARAHGVQRLERNVLVVSIDRLTPALRTAASARALPPFLSGSPLATARESSQALDAAGR
jgi:Nuclease-related domain